MKTMLKLATACLFVLPLSLFAQSDLVGVWNLTIPGEDGQPMTLTVDLAKEGTYTVDFNGDKTPEIKGKYSLKDGQITIEDTAGSNACPGGKGVYKYTVDKANLKMERVSDACEGRGGPEGVMAMTRKN